MKIESVIYTHTHTHIYIYIHICIHIHVHMSTYTYIHTHICVAVISAMLLTINVVLGWTVGSRGKDGGRRKSHPRQRYFRDSKCDVTEMTP